MQTNLNPFENVYDDILLNISLHSDNESKIIMPFICKKWYEFIKSNKVIINKSEFMLNLNRKGYLNIIKWAKDIGYQVTIYDSVCAVVYKHLDVFDWTRKYCSGWNFKLPKVIKDEKTIIKLLEKET